MRVLESLRRKFYQKRNCQKILNRLEAFSNVPVVHKAKKEDGWRKNDPTVPEGWSIKERKDGNNSHLLSPEGFFFPGRRAALRYLIEKNYPSEQVQEMRYSMSHDGWHPDPRLPKNWLYRKEGNTIEFLSQDTTYLRSQVLAMKYLDQNNLTAEKELLETFCQNVSIILDTSSSQNLSTRTS